MAEFAPNVQAFSNVPGVTRQAFDFWAQPVYKNQDGTLFCPGFIGKTYAESTWDKVLLAVPTTGTEQPYTPGVCEVTVNKGRDIDKKKAVGQDGARITIHGIDPATVTIKITIWTPEQLKWLGTIWKLLFPGVTKGKDKNEQAWDVGHPMLDRHNVKSVVFIKGEGPDPGRWPRSRVFTMHAVEWLPPSKTNAKKTPIKSKGSTRDPEAAPTPGSSKTNTAPVKR